MTSVGIMASSVYVPSGVDVLLEPFNNLTAWTVGGTVTLVAGRTGTAVRNSVAAANLSYAIPDAAESDVITIGCAFQWTDANSIVRELLRLTSDDGATGHLRVTFNAAGAMVVQRTTTGIASSATGLVVANTWYYVEVQTRLHDTAGYVIARLNGAEIINATGLDTKEPGTKTVFDTVRLSAITTGATHLWDDLYITMGAGAPFKGSITIP